MRKVILINGIIAGLIVSAMLLVTQPLLKEGFISYDNGMVIGYATMVIGLSMIFFGIKTCRDQYENGTVSFWQAFKVGILIAMIASLIYAATWEVYYRAAASDFGARYTAYYMEKLKGQGASQADLSDAKAEMDKWWASYQNPFFRFAVTLVEIFPVGIVISILSAALLRERRVFPAN